MSIIMHARPFCIIDFCSTNGIMNLNDEDDVPYIHDTHFGFTPLRFPVPQVCSSLEEVGGKTWSDGGRPIAAGAPSEVSGCSYSEAFLENPALDLPALKLDIGHRIEFYESDNKTSLGKIAWRDLNGLHFGGESGSEGVPVAFGGQEKV